MSQPRQDGAMEEYFRWESQSWVEVTTDSETDEKVHFMPLEEIRSYFTFDNNKRLKDILSEVFSSEYPPVDPESVLRDHTAIFCILLSIEQGSYIEYFAQYEELSDLRLPFDPNRPPPDFPSAEDSPALLKQFCEVQRIYCVPIFDRHMLHKRFSDQRLLPIISREPCGIDGAATKSIIRVHAPHNKMLSDSPGKASDCNTFLLKTYPAQEGRTAYNEEVNGFRSVRNAESIINFYGSYIHGNQSNIILEMADKGTLEEYFQRESPPSRGGDIVKFWGNLFQLIKALKAIHSARQGHFNISTQSIVVVSNSLESPFDWHFKLSDFGLRMSEKEAGDWVNEIPKTYAPPECSSTFDPKDPNRRASLKITSSADIWSLGTIYSEVAIWVADGYKGLLEYRKQRADENERILSQGGDCFHDGEQVLQSVLETHRDIESRLRRSDVITKDVLEGMVDEMLWEQDRPNANALIRKADMILGRAQKKASPSVRDEPARPSSRQSRGVALPRFPPPAQPLPPVPPLPRVLTSGLSSINEQGRHPDVENWRSAVTNDTPVDGLKSDRMSLPASRAESIMTDIESSVGDSVSVASPNTTYTTPRTSIYSDFQNKNDRQLRHRGSQSPFMYKAFPAAPSHGMNRIGTPPPEDDVTLKYNAPPQRSPSRSYPNRNLAPTEAPPPVPLARSPSDANSQQDSQPGSPMQPPLRSPQRFSRFVTAALGTSQEVSLTDPRAAAPPSDSRITEETASLRAPSSTGSRRSSSALPSSHPPIFHVANSSESSNSQPTIEVPKPQKRGLGFSLFPIRSRKSVSDHTPSSHSVYSLDSATSPELSGASPQEFEYLSLNTCYEWKMAHKKVKKHALVPALPGSAFLTDLNDRDHTFIIDDAASMAPVWSDVKRVFECLSYIVKGMSPLGTELFFTISYDTWRRKDTHDLVLYLDKKKTAGVTNITYRLNLQLELYRLKLMEAKQKGKLKDVRPASFYILTNGEWGKGADPKAAIGEMTKMLLSYGLPAGQVSIQFISFAGNAAAAMKIKELCGTDFGLDIVDTTRWTGNVLKMLKGPRDKTLAEEGSSSGSPVDENMGRAMGGVDINNLTELA